MTRRLLLWASVCVVNLALAVCVLLLARPSVGTTGDRVGYEFVAQHGIVAECPYSIYCYRVLVPSLLRASPLPEVMTWRLFSVMSNVATGALLAGLAFVATRRPAAGLLASVVYQTSFGATFIVFDPFTPDAAVYLLAAVLAWMWWLNRPVVALGVALVGVFAKETIALVLSAMALAASIRLTSVRGKTWIVVAMVTWLVLLGFHAIMDVSFGWTETDSPSANLFGGEYFRAWLSDSTLTASSRAFYLFIPFGFAWLWAALAWRSAPARLKSLGLTSLVLLALLYLQTPERALATASYVVVPLAAVYLSRLPLALGLLAAATNGLLTARVGISSELLPPISYSLIAAGCLTAAIILRDTVGARSFSSLWMGSSRTTSTR